MPHHPATAGWNCRGSQSRNVTDKKFPGNPTRSFRSPDPIRVIGELVDWTGHSPEKIQAMRDGLADLERRGAAVIYD